MGRAWMKGKKASLMSVAQAAATAGTSKRKALRAAKAELRKQEARDGRV